MSNGQKFAESNTFEADLGNCVVIDSTSFVVGDAMGNVFNMRVMDGSITHRSRRAVSNLNNTILDISSNGNRFATLSYNGKVQFFRVSSFEPLQSFTIENANRITFDKQHVLLARRNGSIQVRKIRDTNTTWDIETHSSLISTFDIIKDTNLCIYLNRR